MIEWGHYLNQTGEQKEEKCIETDTFCVGVDFRQ